MAESSIGFGSFRQSKALHQRTRNLRREGQSMTRRVFLQFQQRGHTILVHCFSSRRAFLIFGMNLELSMGWECFVFGTPFLFLLQKRKRREANSEQEYPFRSPDVSRILELMQDFDFNHIHKYYHHTYQEKVGKRCQSKVKGRSNKKSIQEDTMSL